MWTYEGYWNVVLGDRRNAGDLVREFALTRAGLDEWLGESEAIAWAQSGLDAPMPEAWAGFHARALRAIEDVFDVTAIADLACQDMAKEIQTGELGAVEAWYRAAGQAGDETLIAIIDRMGLRRAERIYVATRARMYA